MALTPSQKEMLFVIGQFFRQMSRQFSRKKITLSISKVEFIENMIQLRIIKKQKRAIYKNLEALQKSRLIEYDKSTEKDMRMSKKGISEYEKIFWELAHYNNISKKILSSKIGFKRRAQTRLRT